MRRFTDDMGQTEAGFMRISAADFDLLQALEEGDACPECEDGRLDVASGPDCSCHLCPPCSGCVEDGLRCNACGWRKSDGAPAEWYTERRMMAGLDVEVTPGRVADADLFAELLEMQP